mmetsp:Transcript_17982/g.49346  ORF Transcript_17982/g.49346 Transcript_17982/m.49346 type:complete len:146 (+) Transcript_17982:488-925(+)
MRPLPLLKGPEPIEPDWMKAPLPLVKRGGTLDLTAPACMKAPLPLVIICDGMYRNCGSGPSTSADIGGAGFDIVVPGKAGIDCMRTTDPCVMCCGWYDPCGMAADAYGDGAIEPCGMTADAYGDGKTIEPCGKLAEAYEDVAYEP